MTLDNFPNSRKFTLPSSKFHSDIVACIIHSSHWLNEITFVLSFILKFKGDQSQQIPPYTYLFVSPVGISGSRGDKIMISAASLVLSNPTDLRVHCDQRGQVDSSGHNLIKNVLIHLFYCHIIMNPEGICIDSFPLVNKNGIFYIPEQ